MKINYKYLLTSLAVIVFACGDKDVDPSPEYIEGDFLKSYTIPAFADDGSAISFTITNPLDCKVTSNQDWCTVDVEKSDKGLLVELNLEHNTNTEERLAEVTISSVENSLKQTISVKQEAMERLVLNGLDRDINPLGETRKINVTGDGTWKLISDVEWLSFNPASGSGNCEVDMIVSSNEDGIVRKANVMLKGEPVPADNELSCEVIQTEPWGTDVRVGNPDIRFDVTKLDAKYPQMQEWQKAGKTDGIPFLQDQLVKVDKVFEAGATCEEIKGYLNNVKYKKQVILLKNGTYTFNSSVRIYSNATLIGESKEGVIIKLQDKGNISMYNGSNMGLRNLTIIGDYGLAVPDSASYTNTMNQEELLAFRTVDMSAASESFVDNVKILNSISHPIFVAGSAGAQKNAYHNTLRDLEIDGAYNKDGGRGYFHMGGDHNLITGCKISHIRHVTFQDESSKYNVFYKNELRQEVSFHNNDGGNNLIEHNRIKLPDFMSDHGFCSIMGPWSVQHKVGGLNFIYRNRCLEEKTGRKPWSDNKLYMGPHWVKPTGEQLYEQFHTMEDYPNPNGGTLYPVVLK